MTTELDSYYVMKILQLCWRSALSNHKFIPTRRGTYSENFGDKLKSIWLGAGHRLPCNIVRLTKSGVSSLVACLPMNLEKTF